MTSIDRRAFTLVELLAVLVIVVLLAATFVPYAASLREAASRARCADNLRGIYEAMYNYSKRTNYLSYPRTRADASIGGRWTAFTGADESRPFAAASAVQPNDVTASMWLLVREEFAQPFRFVCPSSDGTPDALLDGAGRAVRGTDRGNFRGPENFSYSVASPFSAVPEYALTDTLPSNFVLVADQAPSADSLRADAIPPFDVKPARLASINSVNHRRAGQNVLYASGTVAFESSPYCGVGRTRVKLPDGRETEKLDGDNVYTALAPTPLTDTSPSHESPGYAGPSVGPAYRYDTYLVPGAGFAAATPARRPTPPLIAAAPATAATTPSAATVSATTTTVAPSATTTLSPRL